jgi:hypothetical protein
VEDSHRRCASVIGPRVMWEREKDHSELSRLYPPAPLHLLYTRSATGAHNHQLVGAPYQGARSNGPRLGLMPLDARWGQSNTYMSIKLRSNELSSFVWLLSMYAWTQIPVSKPPAPA